MLQHIHLSSERKKVTVSYLCFYGISLHVLQHINISRWFTVLHRQKQAILLMYCRTDSSAATALAGLPLNFLTTDEQMITAKIHLMMKAATLNQPIHSKKKT